MKEVILKDNGKLQPVVKIKKKHPLLSSDDNESTFTLLIPTPMLDDIKDRMPNMIKRCKDGNKPYLTLDFSGSIFVPDDVNLIKIDKDHLYA